MWRTGVVVWDMRVSFGLLAGDGPGVGGHQFGDNLASFLATKQVMRDKMFVICCRYLRILFEVINIQQSIR